MMVPFLDLPAMQAEQAAEIETAWRAVSGSARYVGGPAVDAFEAAWGAYCGVRHCVGVGSGTAALELTLVALGIGRGAEVIVPANSFIATAAAVAAVGAVPISPMWIRGNMLLVPETISPHLTPRTEAVIVVHLYGQPANMDAIDALARAKGLASSRMRRRPTARPGGAIAPAASPAPAASASIRARISAPSAMPAPSSPMMPLAERVDDQQPRPAAERPLAARAHWPQPPPGRPAGRYPLGEAAPSTPERRRRALRLPMRRAR